MSTAEDIDALCDALFENTHQTKLIRDNFGFLLLPIVCKFLDFHKKCRAGFQAMCFTLSILSENNLQIIR